MVEIIFKVIFAYFIGSIVGALFISRFFGGVDIREQGSGNAGATNALLTQGKLFGLLVLIIDFSKGIFVCFFLPSFNLGFLGISTLVDQDILLYLAGFVGLATVSAPIIAAIYLALENFSLDNHLFILTLAISILIAYSHRSNISRMMSGEERKVGIIKKINT